jgi:hypothetical protein
MEVAATNCPRCQDRASHEIYIVQGELGQYAFDVAKARAFVADGRTPHIIPPEIVQRFLDVNSEWMEDHVAHVNPTQPGIVGQRFGGLTLFDGTHRAVLSLRTGTVFRAFVLSLEESESCVIGRKVAQMSAETVAHELRGVIRNNSQSGLIEAELAVTDNEDPRVAEESIRRFLNAEENARIKLNFIGGARGAAS